MKNGCFENAKEMMQALIDGKKVLLQGWRNTEFVHLNNNGSIVDEVGDIFSLNLDDFEIFELYQEPKKLKKVKLVAWVNLVSGEISMKFPDRIMDSEYLKRCPSLDKEVEYEE